MKKYSLAFIAGMAVAVLMVIGLVMGAAAQPASPTTGGKTAAPAQQPEAGYRRSRCQGRLS